MNKKNEIIKKYTASIIALSLILIYVILSFVYKKGLLEFESTFSIIIILISVPLYYAALRYLDFSSSSPLKQIKEKKHRKIIALILLFIVAIFTLISIITYILFLLK